MAAFACLEGCQASGRKAKLNHLCWLWAHAFGLIVVVDDAKIVFFAIPAKFFDGYFSSAKVVWAWRFVMK